MDLAATPTIQSQQQELVVDHARWRRPWRRRRVAGGAHHEQYPPTRALFHALLFLPPAPSSSAGSSGSGSTSTDAQVAALFDGLLGAAVAGEQQDGVVTGARLLSLGGAGPNEPQSQPQPPTTSSIPSPPSPSSAQPPSQPQPQPPSSPTPAAAENPVADAAASRTPGQACATLLLEEEAASLAVVAVPAAIADATAAAAAPAAVLAAGDLALLPYDPGSAASVERALALTGRLPEVLPRLFVELQPPSGPAGAGSATSPLVESVRALCSARPLHSHVVLQAPPSAFACDALAHEAVAACFARFGPPATCGPGGGRRRRRGGARGSGVGFGVGSIVESVLASMEDPGVVTLALGLAAVGLLTLVVRGGLGGREGGRKG